MIKKIKVVKVETTLGGTLFVWKALLGAAEK